MSILSRFPILAVCLAGASLAAGAAEDSTPRIFWDIASESTVFAPNGSYTGYSRLIELADGRLLAVVESGGIKIAFSDDKGATWYGEKKIATNPQGIAECVPDLLQLTDGTIIVGYNPRPSSPYSTERKFGIRCRLSNDGGASWSDEIYVYDASHDGADGCWEPHFIQLPSGELQCYFADESPYKTSNEQQISVCRSFDGGHTWSSPECVSFRPGNRDGMPAAILLEDPDEIVVIVEDNGWYGNMGSFTPTTVRCPLETNWHGYHVGGPEDENRNMIYTFKPGVNMAAPYIRKVASGYTVASCQGLYQRTDGQLDMWVAMGDKRARNFKHLSRPFSLPESASSMWNSLAVIQDSVVVAVGGFYGGIHMIKGYPMQAATVGRSASVTVDGKTGEGETFTAASRKLIPMGTTTRNDAAIDMAYNDTYFYFTAAVADKTSDAENDKVILYLDPENQCTNKLAKGLYRLTLSRGGSVTVAPSLGRAWGKDEAVEGVVYAVNSEADGGGYLMEVAVPWAALGLESAPYDGLMRFAVEIADCRGAETVTDDFTEVNTRRSDSWMPLILTDNPGAGIEAPVADADEAVRIIADGNRLTVDSPCGVERVKLYAVTGQLIADEAVTELPATFTVNFTGMAVASVLLSNGRIVNRKLMLN